MKDRFSITISDAHGVRHYSFNQLVKRFVWWGMTLLLILAILAAIVIWLLSSEIERLEARRAEVIAQYEHVLHLKAQQLALLQSRNNSLQHALNERQMRLESLDQSVRALESLLGAEPAPDLPLERRVQYVQLTAQAKRFLLRVIPNGRPVQNFQGVSSSFGWRKHPVSGTREYHKGIDYRGMTGDKIIATADGVVEYAGFHQSSGFGNMILIDHMFGFRTLYGHLKKVLVKNGDVVKKGQVIALMGNTGLSTGPHLHYEISFIQRALNPAPFVEWNLKNYDSIFKQVRQVPWGSLASRATTYIQAAPPSLQKAALSAEK